MDNGGHTNPAFKIILKIGIAFVAGPQNRLYVWRQALGCSTGSHWDLTVCFYYVILVELHIVQ